MEFQDEIHRPMFPYKFKIKVSACPNDCVAAIARADLAVIGTWKGDIQVDQDEVKAYADAGLNIQREVCDLCPTRCMEWDGKSSRSIIEDCTRCMHCINLMPKALRPGKEKGATILIGGKAPILQGALLSWVIVPFMKMEPPYSELKDLIERIQDWWDENGNGQPDSPSLGDYYEMLWYWSNPSEMLRENWITGISTDTKAPYDEQIVVGLDH